MWRWRWLMLAGLATGIAAQAQVAPSAAEVQAYSGLYAAAHTGTAPTCAGSPRPVRP